MTDGKMDRVKAFDMVIDILDWFYIQMEKEGLVDRRVRKEYETTSQVLVDIRRAIEDNEYLK